MSDSDLLQKIDAEIALLSPTELAAELVRIPSHPGIERQEEQVVLALARFFGERDLGVQLEEILPGRPNLMVSVQGGRPGPHLLFCGHTDTVPLNSGDPGFGLSGDIRDGRLLGRGSVDMKSAVAAMAVAVVALSRHLPAGRVSFAAVIDEEMESLKIRRSKFHGEWNYAIRPK